MIFTARRSIQLAAIIVLLGGPGRSFGAPQMAGEAGEFLSWGAGARALGLGKAYVALATDATAGYWNPAGLAFAEYSDASALHAMLWEGASYDFLGIALPTVGSGTFGWFGSLVTVGGIERRDDENNAVGDGFGVSKFASGLAYGLELSRDFGAGVTAKWVGRSLDGRSTGFLTADFGLRWRVASWGVVGAVLQHAATIRYGDTEDLLRPVLRVGLALAPLPGYGFLVADLETRGGDLSTTGGLRWRVGVESGPVGPLTARVGIDTWEMAGGVGLKIESFTLDYSGALHQDLGLSHRVSVASQWGESRTAGRLLQAKEASARILERHAQWLRLPTGSSEFQSAAEELRREYEELLSHDPSNTAIQRFLRRLPPAP